MALDRAVLFRSVTFEPFERLALGAVPVEQLLGVRPDVLDDLHDRGVPTRVYVPCGPDWLRRLAESLGS